MIYEQVYKQGLSIVHLEMESLSAMNECVGQAKILKNMIVR